MIITSIKNALSTDQNTQPLFATLVASELEQMDRVISERLASDVPLVG